MFQRFWFLSLLPILFLACQDGGQHKESGSKTVEFSVKNPIDQPRRDVLIRLDAHALKTDHADIDFSKIKLLGDTPLPFQTNDLDADGVVDEVVFLIDLPAGTEKNVQLQTLGADEAAPTFEKRTQAEISHKTGGTWQDHKYLGGTFKNVDMLRVPPEHTDHSEYIRYEGPGWESDLVGYRFYLDWRNATDIFGKKTTQMVLQGVGQDGFDSYHEPGEWGMDILKVGESLGIGSPAVWVDGKAQRVEVTDSIYCSISINGPVLSMVRTEYFGWKIGDQKLSLRTDLSIQAGSRMTRCDVFLSRALPNFCTGIVKDANSPLLTDDGSKDWGYLATWGPQSLANDQLGMAVLFKRTNLVEITEDANSHVVVLNPGSTRITYYFLAAWEQEPNGVKTKEEFLKYLDETLNELSQGAKVTMK